MHLRPGELIDLAEGTRSESGAPHLAACARCREQLADLKATIATAAPVNVPEPSPLFWDHFSSRVHHAVAAEGMRAGARRAGWSWSRLLVPVTVGGVAAVIVAIAVQRGRISAPAPRESVQTSVSTPAELLSDPQTASDDPSLMLVAELTPDLDFDSAREAGLAANDSAEHAVTHMRGAELRQLRLLLQEELARPGA